MEKEEEMFRQCTNRMCETQSLCLFSDKGFGLTGEMLEAAQKELLTRK